MRRQSLRPRQIDVHARMRIIRREEDLETDDDAGGGPAGTAAGGPTPRATFAELVAVRLPPISPSRWYMDTLTGWLRYWQNLDDPSRPRRGGAAARKSKKNIPIPVILTVAGYETEVPGDFGAPSAYVRFQALPPADPRDEPVDFDLELAEIKWLRSHPKYGADGDPRYQLPLARFAQMLDALEKASALINPGVVTLAEAETILAKQLGMVKTPLNRTPVDVYNYWVAKRQLLKRPLLRKFWPQTPLNDTNPHLVFRPREKERYKLRKHRKNDMEGFRKLAQLRADFERVRRLLDLVRRRESAKRLQLDGLEEMRQQAIYELTDRSGRVRHPAIPVEGDDRGDRHRKHKKKKKRKHHDGLGEAASGIGVDGTAGVDGGIPTGATRLGDKPPLPLAPGTGVGVASPAGVDTSRIPSFMEYDTSQNFQLDDPNDEELSGGAPAFPSYPISTPQLMAAVFAQPPKFRCRGRIGRGGRFIIDRIPVPSGRYYGPVETSATALSTTHSTLARSTPTGSNTPTAAAAGSGLQPTVGEAINSGLHGAILVHESAFRPPADKLATVTTKRLDEIYAMSDSEDELLEPLSSSVYETQAARKTGGGAGGKMHPHAAPPRAVKFAMDI